MMVPIPAAIMKTVAPMGDWEPHGIPHNALIPARGKMMEKDSSTPPGYLNFKQGAEFLSLQ